MNEERIIDIRDIETSRFQARQAGDVSDLASSIRNNGLFNPIHVWEIESGMELLCGERRLEAYRLLNEKEVRAVVHMGINETEAAAIHWSDNADRKKVGPYEEARTVGNILGWNDGDKKNLVDRKTFLKLSGLRDSQVGRMRRLARLVPEIGSAVDAGTLTKTEGIEISRVPDIDGQTKVFCEYLSLISAEDPSEPQHNMQLLKKLVAKRLPSKDVDNVVDGTKEQANGDENGQTVRHLSDEIGVGAESSPSSSESSSSDTQASIAAIPDDTDEGQEAPKQSRGSVVIEYGECHDNIRMVRSKRELIVTIKVPRHDNNKPTQDIKQAFEMPGDERSAFHLMLSYIDAAAKMAEEKLHDD